MVPPTLFSNIYWACGPTRFDTPETMEAALAAYAARIGVALHGWRPQALVLAAPDVTITFDAWVGDDHRALSFPLHATDDATGFTAVELLFGVLNGVATALLAEGGDLVDHCFFEGLTLQQRHPALTYRVRFGS